MQWATVLISTPSGRTVAAWPLTGVGRPPLGVVDSLARARLAAGRLGLVLAVTEPSPELTELIELAGLGGILGPDGA